MKTITGPPIKGSEKADSTVRKLYVSLSVKSGVFSDSLVCKVKKTNQILKGSNADVWRGTLTKGTGGFRRGTEVAIKRLIDNNPGSESGAATIVRHRVSQIIHYMFLLITFHLILGNYA